MQNVQPSGGRVVNGRCEECGMPILPEHTCTCGAKGPLPPRQRRGCIAPRGSTGSRPQCGRLRRGRAHRPCVLRKRRPARGPARRCAHRPPCLDPAPPKRTGTAAWSLITAALFLLLPALYLLLQRSNTPCPRAAPACRGTSDRGLQQRL